MKPWRDKINTVIPRVRLESQRWEYTQIEEVTSSTYLTEDGEQKSREMQYDLVQQVTQGAQLAAYDIVNGREFGPIVMSCKPHMNVFRLGEAVNLNIPEAGLVNQPALITGRQIDPTNGSVTFTFESETNDKHAFALGVTSTAPPTPTLIPPDELDVIVGGQQPPPPTITLTPSAGGFTFIDFVPADAAAVITINATQNRAGTLVWSASPSVTLGAVDADTKTLSLADFGDNTNVTITVTNEFGAVASLVIPRIDITTPLDSIIPDALFVGDISDGSDTEPPWISNRFTRHIP
jgi:hypothetical protein